MKIGNMAEEVGYVKYYTNKDDEKPIAVGIILGVVIPIIAIIVLLAVCVVRRHRKQPPSQDYIPDVWKEETQAEEGTELNHIDVRADMNSSALDDKGEMARLGFCGQIRFKIIIFHVQSRFFKDLF